MLEFHNRLKEWVVVNNDYNEQNRLQWMEVQEKLFLSALPKRVIWEKIEDIVKVLNILGSIPELNHMFYPEGGGMDLQKASISSVEPGCIELHTGIAEIIKPRRLLFESFGDDAEWNYFRLELRQLASSEPYKDRKNDFEFEEVVELNPGVYVNRWHWDENEYDGEPLPPSARLVMRHTKGAFVVFSKTSSYNQDPSTYDGRHNRMTTSKFRTYIEKSIQHIKRQKKQSVN